MTAPNMAPAYVSRSALLWTVDRTMAMHREGACKQCELDGTCELLDWANREKRAEISAVRAANRARPVAGGISGTAFLRARNAREQTARHAQEIPDAAVDTSDVHDPDVTS